MALFSIFWSPLRAQQLIIDTFFTTKLPYVLKKVYDLECTMLSPLNLRFLILFCSEVTYWTSRSTFALPSAGLFLMHNPLVCCSVQKDMGFKMTTFLAKERPPAGGSHESIRSLSGICHWHFTNSFNERNCGIAEGGKLGRLDSATDLRLPWTLNLQLRHVPMITSRYVHAQAAS